MEDMLSCRGVGCKDKAQPRCNAEMGLFTGLCLLGHTRQEQSLCGGLNGHDSHRLIGSGVWPCWNSTSPGVVFEILEAQAWSSSLHFLPASCQDIELSVVDLFVRTLQHHVCLQCFLP